jgi:hypothetical protein
MNIEELKHDESLKYHRTYVYVCLFCKKKRTAHKQKVAKSRMCSSCRKERIALEADKRQIKLW